MKRLLVSQDWWAGIVLAVIGGLAVWVSLDYEMGRAARMGPGYVPNLLGWGLVGLGLVIAGKALIEAGEPIAAGQLKPALVILGGIVLFGLAIDRLGLVVTVVAVTVLTAFAARERPNLVHVALLAAALAAGSVALFVYGLRQAIPIWWDL